MRYQRSEKSLKSATIPSLTF